MNTRTNVLAVVKSFVVAGIVIVLMSATMLHAGQDIHSQIAQQEIARLTVELDKAEKSGNKAKVRYILAQLKVQGKIIALGNIDKKSN